MKAGLARVEGMIDDHTGLWKIEEYIEARSDLPSEAKSALWLFAWVETDKADRRRAVGELLRGLAHDLRRGGSIRRG